MEKFETTEDKKLKWFAGFPLDVIGSEDGVVHSLDYFVRKAEEKERHLVKKKERYSFLILLSLSNNFSLVYCF